MKKIKGNEVSYAKYGYMFIAPFFIAFLIFQFIPLLQTIYYSFFEYYRSGLKIIGPNPVGFENYAALFEADFGKYAGNTIIMWVLGFIPQIVISLLLAAWFTDVRLKIKGKQFFKVVIYMPNLIMASAFAMLFFALFSDKGPVNSTLVSMGILSHPFRFMSSVWGTRGLVGLMNFLMWFGNTTILLMAAVMGINPSLFEAAELDGCSPRQTFFRVDQAYPGICTDHLDDRRTADVRCSSDPDQRKGYSGPYFDDAHHVSEQPSVQQELRHGRCGIRDTLHNSSHPLPDRVLHPECG